MRTGVAVLTNSIATGSIVRQPLGSGVQVHNSGLLFTAGQSLDTWERIGTNLFSFANSTAWWIADWLVYGETTFHGRYEEAVKRTPLSYQTLRNYTWVARRFPLPRRRQSLSFSHHLEVVALEQPQQDYWLRQAEAHHWSRNKLRAEVRNYLHTQHSHHGTDLNAADTGQVHQLHLNLTAEDLANIERAAGRQSKPLEIWAAETLRRAAAGS